MTPNALALAVAVPFVGWRLYRRVRKNIGRQESKLWRHWSAALLWPLLVAMLALFVTRMPLTLYGLLGGAAAGVVLGQWGLTLTTFEKAPDGAFFTPNPYLGTAIVMLFTARIVYRFYQLFGSGAALPQQGDPMAGLGHSPFTFVVLGLLAGYYASYATGLLRWRYAVESPAA